ncbi:MAG: hypothetical protein ACREMA_00645 [Longimicrobiales bacterium]
MCRACRGWNLLPDELPGETLDACEKQFRDTPQRIAGENVSVAYLADATELIRIGRVHLPEFAAWRYGDVLVERRLSAGGAAWEYRDRELEFIRKHQSKGPLRLGSIALPAAAASLFLMPVITAVPLFTSALAVVGAIQWRMSNHADLTRDFRQQEQRRPLGFVMSESGEAVAVNAEIASTARLEVPQHPGDFRIVLYSSSVANPLGRTTFSGTHARRALRLALPTINAGGARQRMVDRAVRLITETGSSDNFLERAVADQLKRRRRYDSVHNLHRDFKAALEIAVNEVQERAAFEGELWLLEEEWRQAEELAAISDGLVSTQIELRFRELVALRSSQPPR